MERNTIKHIFLLTFLIFHHGQLTKASTVGCAFKPTLCGSDEFCDQGSFLGRCFKRESNQEYYGYDDQGREEELHRDGIGSNERRVEIPQHEYASEERGFDNSEPTLEDRTLIKSLPQDNGYNQLDPKSRSSSMPGPGGLPPISVENWNNVGFRNDINGEKRDNSEEGGPLQSREGEEHENNKEYESYSHLHDEVKEEPIESHDDTTQDEGPEDHLPPIPLNEESKSSKRTNRMQPLQHKKSDGGWKGGGRLEKSDTQSSKPQSADSTHDTHEQSEHESHSGSNHDDSEALVRDIPGSNGKVMIKGEVRRTETSIDQGPNPEKKYELVKDFFKSQQASSIVDVPNAVKREEASKLFAANFVPVENSEKDKVAEEQDLSDSKRSALKISLDKNITVNEAVALLTTLEKALWINPPSPMFIFLNLADSSVKARMAENDYSPEDEGDVAKRINEDAGVKDEVAREVGVHILSAKEENPSKYEQRSKKNKFVVNQQPRYFLITLVVVGCVTGVILSAVAIYLIMKRYNETKKFKPVSLPGQEAAADYQELCRQLRASQGWDSAPIKTTSLSHAEKEKGLLGSTKPPKYTWSEEPVVPNMDISTGHVVLAYMEDHLNNKNRLDKEWEALCTYEAEPNSAELGKQDKNVRKNRYSDVLPYDHNRVALRETANATGSDYVNASFITDHDPRNPAYIATQGPLAHTVSDFWQMVWEQGVVVIVNLTRLSDLGLPQCHRYWPEEGHETYHIYEVHLVSEHIWCDDYLVRSFYLKNLQTSETRTVTQFHFLSWPDLNVPTSPKPLLEFRRKVNKCFRGRSCPIVVHCSGGVGRTGCYILIDMVLNKMMRGAKEIDIAATVEHLRDQRPHMVKTKAQFEFALTAVAEEVNAILQALAK